MISEEEQELILAELTSLIEAEVEQFFKSRSRIDTFSRVLKLKSRNKLVDEAQAAAELAAVESKLPVSGDSPSTEEREHAPAEDGTSDVGFGYPIQFDTASSSSPLPRSLAERAENDVFRSAEFHYTKEQRWNGLNTPQMSPFGKSQSAPLIERQAQVTV